MGMILGDFFRNGFFEWDILDCNNDVRSVLSELVVPDWLLLWWEREWFDNEVESIVEYNSWVCLANELRRNVDDSEARRRDFKSTLLRVLFSSSAVLLPRAAVVVDDEGNGCEFEERMRGKKALSEYLRVVWFDEFLIVEASSDVNSGVWSSH